MKNKLLGLSVIAMTSMALSGTALADGTELNINFMANIRETTCDMKLSGGVGTDTAQTLKIGDSEGKVRIDEVRAGNATANFKLVIVECPTSLKSIKTTVKGTQSADMASGLVNQILGTSGGADYSAVEIARASAPTTPFIINSTTDSERLVWSSTEIANKEVPLVATLRETKSNLMTTGSFQAVATFEFSYE